MVHTNFQVHSPVTSRHPRRGSDPRPSRRHSPTRPSMTLYPVPVSTSVHSLCTLGPRSVPVGAPGPPLPVGSGPDGLQPQPDTRPDRPDAPADPPSPVADAPDVDDRATAAPVVPLRRDRLDLHLPESAARRCAGGRTEVWWTGGVRIRVGGRVGVVCGHRSRFTVDLYVCPCEGVGPCVVLHWFPDRPPRVRPVGNEEPVPGCPRVRNSRHSTLTLLFPSDPPLREPTVIGPEGTVRTDRTLYEETPSHSWDETTGHPGRRVYEGVRGRRGSD